MTEEASNTHTLQNAQRWATHLGGGEKGGAPGPCFPQVFPSHLFLRLLRFLGFLVFRTNRMWRVDLEKWAANAVVLFFLGVIKSLFTKVTKTERNQIFLTFPAIRLRISLKYVHALQVKTDVRSFRMLDWCAPLFLLFI